MNEVPAAADDQQATPHEPGAVRATSEGLAAVQLLALELLARLDRPPQKLRISMNTVTLDITWADEGIATARSPATGPVSSVIATMSALAEDLPEPRQEEYLRSPAVGVFYHASEPGGEPFVSIGSAVSLGQQIGIVEAMKLMMPVEADRAGRVTALVKGNGEPVEYGEKLFAIDDSKV